MSKTMYWKASAAVIALGWSAGGALAKAPAPAAFAADSGADSAQLGDIVVTAQKREQRLNDVGLTVIAASGAQLKSSGVSDIMDLNRAVPGFSAAPTYTGFPVFSIRGVNFNAAQLSAPPAVSVYVDEAVLPYSVMTGGILLDVERVEVLKGPQGTLFGQNATGGSINVIAAKPTANLAAGVSTDVNNFGQVKLEGYVSGPLGDRLRARIAASTTQGGAWQRGYYLNKGKKNGSANRAAARLLLDWTPTDRLTVAVNINGNYDHGEAQQSQPFLISPANPAGAVPGLLGYQLPNDDRDAEFDPGFDTHVRNHMYQGVLRVDYELADDITFTSLTDYARSKTRNPIDLDGTALSIIAAHYGGTVRTFNQEFRISGKLPSSGIEYIFGGNYEKDKIFEDRFTQFLGYSGLPAGAELPSRYNSTNRAVAVYGNIEYEFVPKLSLTAGVRYTDTKQTLTGCTFDGGNGIAAGTLGFLAGLLSGDPTKSAAYVPGGCITVNNVPATPGGTASFLPIVSDLAQKQHNVSWRAGLNYKPDSNTLIYALVSRGYKSGAFPADITLFQSQLNPLGQEKLTAYEIGTKLSLLDRRLQINLSAFYYDYLNKQFYTYVPTPPIGALSTLINIPKAKVKGLDVDFSARPVDGLTLRGALTYIKTEIGNYNGFDLNSQPVNFAGKEFNYAPPLSATFDAEYRFPVGGDLEAYVGGGGLYNDRTFADLGESPRARMRSYMILSARAGIDSHAGWQLGIWVRNLTDKYYWTSIVTGGDLFNRFTGMPRTFGATASFKI